MDDERSPAEARTEALRASLIVRENRTGPVWLACWRDSRGVSKMRTIGPAWLVRIPKHKNVYIEQDASRQRAKHASESWRTKWKPRSQDKDEKPVKLAKGALDYKQAVKAADKLMLAVEVERDELHETIARAGDPRSFEKLVDRWLVVKRREVRDGLLRQSTMSDYEGMLRSPAEATGNRREPHARIMRAFAHAKPRDITGASIDAFLDKLGDEDKLSERTRAKYAVVLGMVLSYATDEGWIKTNPTLDRKRKKRGKRHYQAITIYTVAQVEAIAREASKVNVQDGEIIRFAAYTGLRQGELLALKWRDIDWTGDMIRVESSWDHRAVAEGLPKSGQSRTVPMGRPAAEVLERVSQRGEKTGARDLIFVGERNAHVDASILRRRYVKARDAVCERDADCPAINFHGLRHTFGSLLASISVPIVAIQSYMGHADIATTSIYLHYVPRAGAAAEVTRALRKGSVLEVEIEQTERVV